MVVPFRGVALAAPGADERPAILRAALARAGPDAALSHTSALEVWGVPVPPSPTVHVMTGSRRVRVTGIVAHRRTGFVVEPPFAMVRRGLPVTGLEQSLVDSWPLAGRAPMLFAVSCRTTTVERLRAAVDASSPHLGDRAALQALLGKLAEGCRSELELWGYDHVFTGPGMPSFVRQAPVRIGSRTVYLDLLHAETRTNIELDGAAYHGDPTQRERDLRRDAALAARGYLVVRFTHHRLTTNPDDVRIETRAIIAIRRTTLPAMIIGQL